jgi:archaellum component FlaC
LENQIGPGGPVTDLEAAIASGDIVDLTQKDSEQLNQIRENLERIANRVRRASTAWKMKASNYVQDVAFLLALVQQLDSVRGELIKRVQELESPLILNAAGRPAITESGIVKP